MGIKNWVAFNKEGANLPADKTVISTDYLKLSPGERGSTKIIYTLNGVGYEEDPFEQKGYLLFDIPGAGNTDQVGAPMLIREGLFVALPEGAVFESLSAAVVESRELEMKDGYRILPVPKPALETEKMEFLEDRDFYGREQAYPREIALYVGMQKVEGVPCAHLLLFPMEYRAASNKLTLRTKIELTANYRFGTASDGKRTKRHVSGAIRQLLLGYEADAADQGSEQKERLVIITSRQLRYSFEIFAAQKKFRYRTEIVEVEDILSQKPGWDAKEAIHSFLMDEHDRDPISYVILGGDLSVIPARSFEHDVGKVIDDTFYCRDIGRYVPQFAMSRFPGATRAEMNKMTDLATYYPRFYSEKRKNAVFSAYNDDSRGYRQCKIDIKSTADGLFQIAEHYDAPGATKANLIRAINAGNGFVNYRGHGGTNGWSSSNGIKTGDIDSLDVGMETPHFLSIACKTNAVYDTNCMGVQIMKKCKAISFLGASAASYTSVNHIFDKYLWEALTEQKLSVIGDIFKWATITLYMNKPSALTEVNIQEYLLLGDVTADYLEEDSDG